MPIDPFTALNALIRAEAVRIRPDGTGAPEEEPAEREEERRPSGTRTRQPLETGRRSGRRVAVGPAGQPGRPGRRTGRDGNVAGQVSAPPFSTADHDRYHHNGRLTCPMRALPGPVPRRTPATSCPAPRAAPASPVRLAGALDPEVGVDQRVAGARRGRSAQCTAGRVAPGIGAGVRAVAIAARVDDEVLVAEGGGEPVPVLGAGRVRLKRGHIEGEPVRLLHARLPQRSRQLLLVLDPAGVPGVQVHLRGRSALQLSDGVGEESDSRSAEGADVASTHQVRDGIRLRRSRGGPLADAAREGVDPQPVRVRVLRAALRQAPAVAVRNVVRDENGDPAGRCRGARDAPVPTPRPRPPGASPPGAAARSAPPARRPPTALPGATR